MQELSFTQASEMLSRLPNISKKHLQELFAEDSQRHEKFSISTQHLYFDYSRQRVTSETIRLLIELAKAQKLEEKRNEMFAGKKINCSEERSVLHIALRSPKEKSILVDGKDVIPDVHSVLAKIEKFTKEIHDGTKRGATGKKLKNILAIGIGGSYLGPECLALACRPYRHPDMSLRFVANIDGTDFTNNTQDWSAEETLVIIISKTFTTAETMHNARTAREWLISSIKNSDPHCIEKDIIEKHCIAVSTAEKLVKDFGIAIDNMFGFWDWVGGRFSVTSAVGAVPLSLYLGYKNFQEILNGAYWMDQHFLTAPLEKNIPVICGLIDIWNINFLGLKCRALLPYSQGLARLAAYTQQGEMESNGKSVDIKGIPVNFSTGEVVFGEPGTNGQHSFYQLIHQGSQIIPCDFLGFIEPEADPLHTNKNLVTHHEELLTNFLAQPDALAFGKKDSLSHKNFDGNRPSNSFLFQKLDPFTAGLIISLTEHRIAVKGFVWGINSFDQFGVELGKKLGSALRDKIIDYHAKGSYNKEGLNPSTIKMLDYILKKQLP